MVRRALVILLVGATVAVVASVAGASHGGFHAELVGFSEVPAISTTGQGTFTGTVVPGPALRYRLEYSGLEGGAATAAHIHLGQTDVNGGVSAFLCGGGDKPPCPPSGAVRGTIDPADIIGPSGQGIAAGEFDEVIAAMEAGVTYANVHTEMFPGGEIRGQIQAD
jgi:CHRD domain